MRAVPAHKELDAVIEGVQVLLGRRGLCLLDDVQWIRGAQAQRVHVAEGLEAAVRVHAVQQAICRDDSIEVHTTTAHQPCLSTMPSFTSLSSTD